METTEKVPKPTGNFNLTIKMTAGGIVKLNCLLVENQAELELEVISDIFSLPPPCLEARIGKGKDC